MTLQDVMAHLLPHRYETSKELAERERRDQLLRALYPPRRLTLKNVPTGALANQKLEQVAGLSTLRDLLLEIAGKEVFCWLPTRLRDRSGYYRDGWAWLRNVWRYRHIGADGYYYSTDEP